MRENDSSERYVSSNHVGQIAAAKRQAEEARARGSTFQRLLDEMGAGESSDREHLSLPGYEVIERLRGGSQGVVYRARQSSTGRDVAIKVMRFGVLASAGDRTRFEREVQVLGGLRHPNIVTIHDSGTSHEMQYFVMDFVPGGPLDEYVVQKPFDVRKTLALFSKICAAVEAAHLHGVIHRDLKPSNIRIDDRGEPHVLDFGLAKVATAGDVTAVTQTGQFLGSLPWASPEQVSEEADVLDLRSDVYSLGVMLYHALCGKHPYDVSGGFRTVANRIMAAEPAPPSHYDKRIDGDIDTIVMKCLAKAAERRYQSAGELRRDLEHFLNNEPIEAKRDSITYVVTRQLRRYRTAIGITLGFAVLATTGFVISLGFWRQAEIARLSERAQREQLERSEKVARDEADRATAILDYVRDMLASANPDGANTSTMTVADLLDDSVEKLDTGTFGDRPSVEAGIRETLGDTYFGLGSYDLARQQLTRALELTPGGEMERREVRATLQMKLGTTHRELGHLDEANALLLQTRRLRTDLFGASSAEVGECTFAIAQIHRLRGDFEKSEELHRLALDARIAALGESHVDVAESLREYSTLLTDMGRYEEAEQHARRALAIYTVLFDEGHPSVSRATHLLATIFRSKGDLAEAERLNRRALELARAAHGSDHPDIAQAANSLGVLLWKMDRLDEAEPLLQEALEIFVRRFGDRHVNLATPLNNLALLQYARGNLQAAADGFQRAVQVFESAYGDQHPSVATALNNVASVELRLGDLKAAEQHFRESLRIREATLPATHADIAQTLSNLAKVFEANEDDDQAKLFLRRAVSNMRKNSDRRATTFATCLDRLGGAYMRGGEFAEALPLLEEALAVRTASLGPAHADTVASSLHTAAALVGLKEFVQAEALLLETYQRAVKSVGEKHTITTQVRDQLDALCKSLGKEGCEQKFPHTEAIDSKP